jgi:hypothetical protein
MALVQPINNVGSQQALENNWNDENAVQKFERARESASRERRDELSSRPRPNAVELGVGSPSADSNSKQDNNDKGGLPFSGHTVQPSASYRQTEIEKTSVVRTPTTRHPTRYLAGPAILLCVVVVLAVGLYLA